MAEDNGTGGIASRLAVLAMQFAYERETFPVFKSWLLGQDDPLDLELSGTTAEKAREFIEGLTPELLEGATGEFIIYLLVNVHGFTADNLAAVGLER